MKKTIPPSQLSLELKVAAKSDATKLVQKPVQEASSAAAEPATARVLAFPGAKKPIDDAIERLLRFADSLPGKT